MGSSTGWEALPEEVRKQADTPFFRSTLLFDPAQPRVNAPLLKRFRHYVNLDRTGSRLEHMLSRFEFTTMAEVLHENGRSLR